MKEAKDERWQGTEEEEEAGGKEKITREKNENCLRWGKKSLAGERVSEGRSKFFNVFFNTLWVWQKGEFKKENTQSKMYRISQAELQCTP